MEILRARENGMFFQQCLGWFDLKETHLFESVGFEETSMKTLFCSLFIMISINGSWVSLASTVCCIARLILFKISSSYFGFIKLKKMKKKMKEKDER